MKETAASVMTFCFVYVLVYLSPPPPSLINLFSNSESRYDAEQDYEYTVFEEIRFKWMTKKMRVRLCIRITCTILYRRSLFGSEKFSDATEIARNDVRDSIACRGQIFIGGVVILLHTIS